MIYYRNDVRASGVDGRALVATAKKLLAAVDERDSSLSLTVVDDAAIRELNRDHRGKDKPTDVLSFPMFEGRDAPHAGVERMLGDVVISVETARRQAAEYDATLQRELYRLAHSRTAARDWGTTTKRPANAPRWKRRSAASRMTIGMPWPYATARP